jgi:hypothetical protein
MCHSSGDQKAAQTRGGDALELWVALKRRVN